MAFAFVECEKRSAERSGSPEGVQPFGRMEPYVIRFPSCQEKRGDLQNAVSAGKKRKRGRHKTEFRPDGNAGSVGMNRKNGRGKTQTRPELHTNADRRKRNLGQQLTGKTANDELKTG
jgi:hypothetical protein